VNPNMESGILHKDAKIVMKTKELSNPVRISSKEILLKASEALCHTDILIHSEKNIIYYKVCLNGKLL
jgi:hypothetical protein